MGVPLSAVHEDTWLNLHRDPFADPEGKDEAFAEPQYVWKARQGAPTNADEMSTTYVRYLGGPPSDEEEDRGMTLIVSAGNGHKTTLLYFPDDQHEVDSVDDPDGGEDDFG